MIIAIFAVYFFSALMIFSSQLFYIQLITFFILKFYYFLIFLFLFFSFYILGDVQYLQQKYSSTQVKEKWSLYIPFIQLSGNIQLCWPKQMSPLELCKSHL